MLPPRLGAVRSDGTIAPAFDNAGPAVLGASPGLRVL